ncbi:MAG TPA: TlyA family RNA methyltransferase [Candidatus Acidoferrales bacterium]|nr:TlyA family RNA methyltransferase [Candidatus Acidoferrales bacterium]
MTHRPKTIRETNSQGAHPQAKTPKRIKPGKARLDLLVVERGLAPSRERAQALLLAGQVRVNGVRADKPGTQVAADARIEIFGETLRYASRGGLKLEGALEDFRVSVRNRVCLDVGSSTGGFTDCLLQNGARRVYAVDVTIGQLDWKLQQDVRVSTLERNARYLRPEDIGEPVDMVVADVSFISLTRLFSAIVACAAKDADLLALIKPQFELERRDIGKGGIVRDPALHQKAIERVSAAAVEAGLEIIGVRASRLPGAEGNQEFFLHARRRE